MKRPIWSRKSKAAFLVFLSSGFLTLATGSLDQHSAKRWREAESKTGLAVMRPAIEHYTEDNGKPPQSLKDLLDEAYLREIPTDPLTGKKDWVPHFGNVLVGPGKTSFGIDDVHSKHD